MQRTGVALIGAGQASKAHAKGYISNPYVEILYVIDTDLKKAQEAANLYKSKYSTNVDDALNDPKVKIIDITTPHTTHYELARKALIAGKNVIMEKPMATNYEQCLDLIELAKNKNVKFMIAENTRFIKLYQKIDDLLKEKIIGEVYNVFTLIEGSEVHRLMNNSWIGKKEHGGLILDAGVHTFYLYKWLFGGVKNIKTIVWNSLSKQEVEDNAIMVGTLENGSHFVHRLSNTSEKPWTERIEIHGTKGVIFGDQLFNPPLRLYLGSDTNRIEGGYTELYVNDVPYNPSSWKSQSIVEEIEHFLDCVINDRQPLVDPVDTAYAVRIADEARRNIIAQL